MTAIAYAYQTPAELSTIEQITLPELEAAMDSPWLENFPDVGHRDTVIMWDQLDNFTGLMQFRGYGNKPNRVNQIGIQRFQTKPLVYGEFMALDEEQLTRRGMMGSFTAPMDVSDMVSLNQRQLLVRRLQLKEYIVANFVINGTYTVTDGAGVAQNGDSWTPQTYTPTYSWSNASLSTPLYDMQQMALVPFGQSVDVGPSAELCINRITFNRLMLNRNSNDFWGMRNEYGATIPNSLGSVNKMFVAYGLPSIRLSDRWIKLDNSTRTGSTTRLLPTTNAVLFGRRTSGAKPGEFAMTWNDQNQAMKPYTFVKYHENQVPRTIEVHDGFNGAPIIKYPGTIVVGTGF